MKTNPVTLSSNTANPLQAIPAYSRLANFGRLMVATSCVSLVSFAAVPQALAAGANGDYNFTSASGSVKYDGHKINIPQALVKKIAGFTHGEITIENNTLKFDKNYTGKIVEDLGDDLDIDIEASVKGPNNVVLAKSGTVYTGKTVTPVAASFEGDFHGEDFSGKLKSNVTATVKNKTLTVVVTFSGGALGEDFSGKLTIVGKR
jgi:hypothetical protein